MGRGRYKDAWTMLGCQSNWNWEPQVQWNILLQSDMHPHQYAHMCTCTCTHMHHNMKACIHLYIHKEKYNQFWFYELFHAASQYSKIWVICNFVFLTVSNFLDRLLLPIFYSTESLIPRGFFGTASLTCHSSQFVMISQKVLYSCQLFKSDEKKPVSQAAPRLFRILGS